MSTPEKEIIEPQEGFQVDFLSSPADIVIGGGAAGAGKTYALLLETLRNIHVSGFNAVCFRRTTPEITNSGGLWDTSEEIYIKTGATPKTSIRLWEWSKYNSSVKFSHLEHEKDIFGWQGSQICLLMFDELTHFSARQFWYLLSRNRSKCGVKPYVRATCNPDPNSWVATLLEWWIDEDTGFPIKERIGVLRYFIRDKDRMVWGNTPEEVYEKAPYLFPKNVEQAKQMVKSITFIDGKIYDNKKLLDKDPSYLANLLAQDEVERKKLLDGNWKVTSDGLALFDYIAVRDMYTNHIKQEDERSFITVDAAGYGQDLAIITTWIGKKAVRTDIYTKSSPEILLSCIEERRKEYNVPTSHVCVDADGLGWGLTGKGYFSFNGGTQPIEQVDQNHEYKNLKTQCFYFMAKDINDRKVSFSTELVFIDGVHTTTITRGSVVSRIEEVITSQLLAIKRKNPDNEHKKQINSKEEQKVILSGASPDFADVIMMRKVYDLLDNMPQRTYQKARKVKARSL